MYCNKCGKPIPNGSTFCNVCGSPQQKVAQAQAPKMPTSYIAVCWITFGLAMLIGCILGLWAFFNSEDKLVYKAIVLVGAACIFIPQIRIKSLDSVPWLVYLIKFIIAAAALLII